MKQVICLPRTMPCDNCGGRTALEFDRVDVALGDGTVLHLSSVPYFQCRECDHRQMETVSQERLDAGVGPFLAENLAAGRDVGVLLHWREVISLGLDGEGHERLYEVEWVLV